jgi:heme/copper-type cytochrome/quinol oxidase subunit 2
MEKNFSNEESLQLIKTMVGISRQNLRNGGIYYILYGGLFFVASLVQYFLYAVYKYERHWTTWIVAGILAGFIAVFLRRKSSRAGSVITYLTRLNRYLWTAFIVGVVFIGFLGFQQFISYTQINPLIIMLYGFAVFITGGMLKFRWLMFGAVAAWIIPVISSFMEYNIQMLLVSLTILVSYLIPGLLLNYSKERDA